MILWYFGVQGVIEKLSNHYWSSDMMKNNASKSPPPRQHHTVAATYLAGFCLPDSDRLAVLDLRTGEIRHQHPSKVMRRRDYFRQRHAPDGVDEFILERAKSERFESQLRTVIDKLCRGGHDLTEDELILFIQHLELQRLTVPRQARFLKSMGARFITNFALGIPEVADGLCKGLWKIEMKDEFRFTSLRDILKTGKIFTFLSRMVWNVWDAPERYAFVTSDNPVTIYNPHMSPSEVAGVGLVGSMLFFPLNSRHCLELFHRESLGEPELDPLTPLDVQPFDVDGVHIRAGRTMPPDMAYVVNCLQGLHADQHLAGSDEEILQEVYESLKTGTPRPNKMVGG